MISSIENDRNKPILIVDTDIFSYWFKNNTHGEIYRQYAVGSKMALTFATVGELYYWAYIKKWGPDNINNLERAISEYMILPYDYFVSQQYAKARVQQERKGEAIGYTDYWIAACALSYDCPIITNNYSHFSRIKGIKLLGPYSN